MEKIYNFFTKILLSMILAFSCFLPVYAEESIDTSNMEVTMVQDNNEPYSILIQCNELDYLKNIYEIQLDKEGQSSSISIFTEDNFDETGYEQNAFIDEENRILSFDYELLDWIYADDYKVTLYSKGYTDKVIDFTLLVSAKPENNLVIRAYQSEDTHDIHFQSDNVDLLKDVLAINIDYPDLNCSTSYDSSNGLYLNENNELVLPYKYLQGMDIGTYYIQYFSYNYDDIKDISLEITYAKPKCQHDIFTLMHQEKYEPTCTDEGGIDCYFCFDCHTYFLDQNASIELNGRQDTVIPPLGHIESSTGDKEPTCTDAGYTGKVTCERCKKTLNKGSVIPALGHDEKTVGKKEPACHENGYTGDIVCNRCEKVLKSGTSIPGLEHIEEIKGFKEATCISDGYTGDKVCKICNVTLEKGTTIRALGHEEKVINEMKATCTEEGYTGDTVCERCNQTIKRGTTIPALGHKEKVINEIKATCSKEGYTGDTVCERCNQTIKKGTAIPVSKHIGVLKYRKEATCVEEGYTGDKVCEFCDKLLEKGTIILVLEHIEEIKGFKKATCISNGYTGDKVCKTCNATLENGTTILALGHKNHVINSKNPTCIKEGYTGDTYCTECNELVKKGNYIPKLRHNYVNRICTVCGAIELGDIDVSVDNLPLIDTTKPVDKVAVGTREDAKNILNETTSTILENVTAGNDINNLDKEIVEEIKNILVPGADVKVNTKVVIDTLDERNVDTKHLSLITETLKSINEEAKVVQYLDLGVLMNITVDNQTVSGKISTLSKPMTFTVAIPEEFKTVNEGYTRTYFVVRVHNGVSDKLPVIINADGTLSFTTDRFSTYALAYSDEAEITVSNPTTSQKPTQTGDNTNIALYAMISGIALVVGVVVMKKKRVLG